MKKLLILSATVSLLSPVAQAYESYTCENRYGDTFTLEVSKDSDGDDWYEIEGKTTDLASVEVRDNRNGTLQVLIQEGPGDSKQVSTCVRSYER